MFKHLTSHRTMSTLTKQRQFQFRNYSSGVGATKRQFKDRTTCCVQAGKGGDGIATFRREKYVERGGPDGGDGGRGGSVFVQTFPSATPHQTTTTNFKSLSHIGFHQKAESGQDGMSKKRRGKNGEDLILYVPPGTTIRDVDTGELLADISHGIDQEGQHIKYCIAKGGSGGLGNIHFASGSNRGPKEFTLGKTGEQRIVELELKAIADVGLVGYPNAGKSTFLSAVSPVQPKIAPYPFTTLHPTVGEVIADNFATFTMADIPGLIAGAHANIGLGHEFLRHIERTQLLIYVIDISGLEGMGVWKDEEGNFHYDFKTEDTVVDIESETPLHLIEETPEEAQRRRDELQNKKYEEADETFLLDYGLEDEDDPEANIVQPALHKTPKLQKRKKRRRNSDPRVKSLDEQREKQRLILEKQNRDRKRALRLFERDENIIFDEDEEAAKEKRFEEIRIEFRKNRDKMFLLEPWEILKQLETELELYIPGLSQRAKLIVANKMDVPGAAKNLETLRKHTNLPIFPVSAINQSNLKPVVDYVHKLLTQAKDQKPK